MNHEPEDQQDPTEAILADLEDLRAQAEERRSDEDPSTRDEALAVLDSIADRAESLRAGDHDDDEADEDHVIDRDADTENDAPAAPSEPDRKTAEPEPQAPAASRTGRGRGQIQRKSARSAVANRGLIFEAYVGESTEADDEADEDTAAEESVEDARRQPVALDVRNPFAFNAVRGQDDDEPLPAVSVPAGGGLLFQTPQAELGQQVDPDWDPEDDDDDDIDDDDRDDERSSDDDDRGADDRRSDDDDDQPRRRRRGGRGRRSRSRGGQNDTDSDDDRNSDRDHSDDSGDSRSSGSSDRDRSSGDDGGRGSRSRRADRAADGDADDADDSSSSRRRRRRRSRSDSGSGSGTSASEITGVKGSTRMEAKRQRRREGREAGRRRPVISEAEFLARRESVERTMLVRDRGDRTQLVVTEDGVAVEHYLSESKAQASLIGNVYLGKVQNVLPSMEAAFVDIGKGRNAVLYAGEVNWDALGMDGKPRRIELALNAGDSVLVQVTKDPIGHKGARLTAQISLPGRFLVYVPGNDMTGISRKLPDNERQRLKKLLKQMVPESAGVIVRTAAEGASETELGRDIDRLSKRWESIEKKSKSTKTSAPQLLYKEPDMIVRIIRDVFNEDFSALVVDGDESWDTIHEYVEAVAPDLLERLSRYDGEDDIFDHYRVSEQVDKALQRKVMLPSGGSLVIDRTEAMTVIDVNTGKFTGSGGNLEETVTKNNLEAAEEVIRQLRLRDIGGIIVVDFIDMVLESNRDLVVRRLVECLGRDRTRHQVAEVTSLGLVQMTRKRIGTGLAESLAAAGEDLSGRGLVLPGTEDDGSARTQYTSRKRRGQNGSGRGSKQDSKAREDEEKQSASRSAVAAIAKATLKSDGDSETGEHDASAADSSAPQESSRESAADNGGKAGKRRGRKSKKASGQQESQPESGDAATAEASEAKTEQRDAVRVSGGRSKRGRNRRSKRSDDASHAADAPTEANAAAAASAGADSPGTADAPGISGAPGSAEPTGASGTADAAAQADTPAPRRRRKATKPSGPAPLMIGAEAQTRVQQASPAGSASDTGTTSATSSAADSGSATDSASAASTASAAAAGKASEPKEQKQPKRKPKKAAAAPPILIIGADD